MDETYWKDPYKFRPERFIDGEGKLIQTSYFMPFGSGKKSHSAALLHSTC